MSWYDEMEAAGRSKSLTTDNIRCGVAAVHEVLGSPALETPVNCHSEHPLLYTNSNRRYSASRLNRFSSSERGLLRLTTVSVHCNHHFTYTINFLLLRFDILLHFVSNVGLVSCEYM